MSWVRTAVRPCGFLKGKVASVSGGSLPPSLPAPAVLLVRLPELVFRFSGGGCQEFAESLESEEALGDLAKSLPSPSSSPGRPACPYHPSTPFSSPCQVLANTVQGEIQGICPGLPHSRTLDAGECLLQAFQRQSRKGGREGLTPWLCPSGLRHIRDQTLSTEYPMGGAEE